MTSLQLHHVFASFKKNTTWQCKWTVNLSHFDWLRDLSEIYFTKVIMTFFKAILNCAIHFFFIPNMRKNYAWRVTIFHGSVELHIRKIKCVICLNKRKMELGWWDYWHCSNFFPFRLLPFFLFEICCHSSAFSCFRFLFLLLLSTPSIPAPVDRLP